MNNLVHCTKCGRNFFDIFKGELCIQCGSYDIEPIHADHTSPDLPKQKIRYLEYDWGAARPQSRNATATRTVQNVRQTGIVNTDMFGTPLFEWMGTATISGKTIRVTGMTTHHVNPPSDIWVSFETVDVGVR